MAKRSKSARERLMGNVKEGIGRLVGNRRLEMKGRAGQTMGNARQAAKKIKDALTQ
jgi:uncharacterized protein YjbJ (UPF0337 family)